MKRSIFFIILSFIFLSGCGYTTHAVLPSGASTIYVANFVNKITVTKEITDENPYYAYVPGMEITITRDIINRFLFDGNYQIMEKDRAHFLLKGQLINFNREPLRYDANNNVVEYRLHVSVDMELYDLKAEKLIWKEDRFAGEATYRTTGQYAKSESTAVNEAIQDLACRVVERTVENW